MAQQQKKHLDIVTPCYNEGECVRLFYDAVTAVMGGLDYAYTIYYINDGSRDNTLDEIKKLVEVDGERVKYVSFSRNFGKEAAIYAGLQATTAEYVVLMDTDLQHPPTLIPAMLDALEEGYDSCTVNRVDRRGEPVVRSFFANAFYGVINSMSQIKLRPRASDFRMMKREMVDALLSLGEYERFSKGLFEWVGYKTKWIEYENVQRAAGETKWSFMSLMKYAISGIVAFTTAPLRLATVLGALVIAAAVITALVVFIQFLIFGTNQSGTSTIVILLLFIGGVIIFLLGIIGEYIARIYSEVKRRPIYIAKESNIKQNKDRVVNSIDPN
jgi:glycosyltransferase involved in cell wall biosynthesis